MLYLIVILLGLNENIYTNSAVFVSEEFLQHLVLRGDCVVCDESETAGQNATRREDGQIGGNSQRAAP